MASEPIKHILITGGTGLVGKTLIPILLSKGYNVSCLSRSSRKDGDVRYFRWDLDNGFLEDGALENVDAIVHLAGANVGESKWTDARKKAILDSRVDSIRILKDHLEQQKRKLPLFISASAIGYYGFQTSEKVFTEAGEAGSGFLADVCKLWEEEAHKMKPYSERHAIIRVGVVLDSREGALAKMATPVKWMVGAPLGSGKQYLPWIHLQDIARMFAWVIENPSTSGIFNGVAPKSETNREFTKALGKVLKRPLLLPPVPAAVIRMIMGEMAVIALEGSQVEPLRAKEQGFEWKFEGLQDALTDIYEK